MDVFNPATAFIDFFAMIGWAYDLKTASRQIVINKQKRSGNDDDYGKRNTAFYEWFTGLIVMTLPLWLFFILRLLFNPTLD